MSKASNVLRRATPNTDPSVAESTCIATQTAQPKWSSTMKIKSGQTVSWFVTQVAILASKLDVKYLKGA
jgi:hypothetical protein